MHEGRADLFRVEAPVGDEFLMAEAQANRLVMHTLWRILLRLSPNWRLEVDQAINKTRKEMEQIGFPTLDADAGERAMNHAGQIILTTFTLDGGDQDILDALYEARK